MKKLLLILFLISTLKAFSQDTTYIPFPTNYGFWAYYYLDDFYQPTYQHTDYMLSGDTSINGKGYKKISNYTWYRGAVRDTNQTIYYVPADSTEEYMLYDFKLELGDTFIFEIADYYELDTMIVTAVDSILLVDGFHKQMYLRAHDNVNTPLEAIWVEGVGNIYDLLYPTIHPPGTSGFYKLYCMSSDTNFIYPNISHCVVSEKDEIEKNGLDLFPNPSGGDVSIIIEDKSITQIKITGVAGNCIKEINTYNQPKITIDNLQPGLYILTAYDKNKPLGYKKLIIQ